MKKSSAMIFVFGSIGLLLITTAVVKAEDSESTVTQMNSELEQSGVVTLDESDAQGLSDKDLEDKVNEAGKEMPVEKRASIKTEKEQNGIESVRKGTEKGYFPEERQSGRSMGARQGRTKK